MYKCYSLNRKQNKRWGGEIKIEVTIKSKCLFLKLTIVIFECLWSDNST